MKFPLTFWNFGAIHTLHSWKFYKNNRTFFHKRRKNGLNKFSLHGACSEIGKVQVLCWEDLQILHSCWEVSKIYKSSASEACL
mgnify:CR=1 FL=1